ncbi:MAG: RdgB/HAM1 family non-canonical purine NTP pyrophosphatase [Bacillota bacterium]|nr:RdgB/HAM1 family non-canonical purine NTP pyrophosphatase [Bacillota bacterium]
MKRYPFILFATHNEGKVAEVADILRPFPTVFRSLQGVAPHLQAPEETGTTYRENAWIKAKAALPLGYPVLADDSGLEVEALGGAPGVQSAYYAGPEADSRANNRKLLEALKNVPWEKRQARYVAFVLLALPDGRSYEFEGTCRGYILPELRGEQGFGYDPLFYVPLLGKTFAEAGPRLKRRLSHRARALRPLLPLIPDLLIREEDGPEASPPL